MKIEVIDNKIKQIKADVELVFVVNGKTKHKWVDIKDFQAENFKGETDKISVNKQKRKIYIGVDSLKHESLRIGSGLAVKALKNYKYKSIKIGLYGDSYENIKAVVEGFLLGVYNFQNYKSKKIKNSIIKIIISSEEYNDGEIDKKIIKDAVDEAAVVSKSVNLTRDVVNMIPAEMHPVKLAEIAKDMAKENSLEINVYGEKFLEKEKMEAFLAVSKASPYPPQLIHFKYKADKPKAIIALVGKGLTYDSGGLSIKPSNAMTTMKSDMSGAASILGIMKAISKLDLPFEIHGIIGATENVVGKHAYKVDDVLKAKNGKTIEVRNTDAEGRLVLADCLVYAQEFKPDYIIDLATLTGACVVALGEYTIGAMGNNFELKQDLIKAGKNSGELITDLPFNRYLAPLIKSEVADIRNTSLSSYGGAITAALFLNEFIEKKNKDKWVHLDIAGPAYVEKSWGYNSFGGSGAGVRLIIEWLKKLQ
jgi:leucyl aminopeptidase